MAYCYICQRDACSNPEHANPFFVTVPLQLVERLESASFRRLDWQGYHVAPGPYGKLPILFQFSPLSALTRISPTQVWWMRSAETAKGAKLHQLNISLVEVPAGPAALPLNLFEATKPLSAVGRAKVSLRGRSETGYFLLTTSTSAETVSHETVADAVLNLEITNMARWTTSTMPGVLRQISDGKFAVYDHRDTHDDVARVVVGIGDAGTGRTWTYVHFYPVPAGTPAVGRFVLNYAPHVPVIDYDREGVQWVGQSSTYWMFFILSNTETDLPSGADAVESVTAATEDPAHPQLLLDALENLLLTDVASGYEKVAARMLYTESQLDESWEKYKKIRARAERTSFVNESATSFKLAIFLLARMCGYERGMFDEYVEQMTKILTETETNQTEEEK